MRIGLDLGGHTGVAIQWPGGEIEAKVWRLDLGNLGGRRSPLPAERLLRRLRMLSREYDVQSVAFEETFAQGNAKFRLDSLQTVTMVWALRAKIPWMRIPVGTVKSHAGSRDKEVMFKRALKKWPELRLWSFDQSDALWVLDYALQKV